jgi:hypothetical protein
LRLIYYAGRIQRRLAVPTPSAVATLDEYLAFYAETDEHRLELMLALARKSTDAISNETLIQQVDAFLSRLEEGVARRLDSVDQAVATIIEKNPEAYRKHTRNSSRFLKSAAGRMRNPKSRLFVWLFDGMRWDTWVDVVRPVLEEGFRVEDQKALFAPLPTYTAFARTSVFAGAYPDVWRGIKGGFTHNEGELAARNFGVTNQTQYEQEVTFVTKTDTAPGKSKFRELQPRRFNFLVFNISDDNIHDEQGDLREVNDAIRMKIRNDVLPEMKRMVEAGDVVLITSDHGFVQLRRDGAVVVSVLNEAQPEVRRRYALNREELDGVVIPGSDKRGVQSTTCAVGRSWFSRQTSQGRNYTRYDHGGLSLSEMVVPGVVLHRALEPEKVQLEITTPTTLEAREDEPIKILVKVANQGTASAFVRVTVSPRPAKTLEINKGEEKSFTFEVTATLSLGMIAIQVEHRGSNSRYAPVAGGMRQIPVQVRARTDKVEFSDALDIFSDLEDES